MGIRHDRVNRKGTVAHHEEEEHHDEDDHDEEDHDDEHHDEHEMEAYDIDRNETSVALSIDRELNDNIMMSLGLASVKRAPSSVELFMNGAHLATGRFEVGDVTLESETSNNIDLTFDYKNNGFFATLRVDNEEMDFAFSLYPTPMKALIDVANAGMIMPPKSTWFEPKLLDGLLSHRID